MQLQIDGRSTRIWLTTTCIAPAIGCAIWRAENVSKFSFYLDTHRFRQLSAISAASRDSAKP